MKKRTKTWLELARFLLEGCIKKLKRSLRERWKKEKQMLIFSFFHLKRHQDSVDVLVYEPIRFDKVYKERKIIDAEGLKIPVISIRHLKQLKKKAGRPQDISDIEALEEVEILSRKIA